MRNSISYNFFLLEGLELDFRKEKYYYYKNIFTNKVHIERNSDLKVVIIIILIIIIMIIIIYIYIAHFHRCLQPLYKCARFSQLSLTITYNLYALFFNSLHSLNNRVFNSILNFGRSSSSLNFLGRAFHRRGPL